MDLTDKIPIRIVQTQDIHNTKKISILVDFAHYVENSKTLEKKVEKFKKLYFNTLQSAKKLFYGRSLEEKKYRDLPSSLYWDLGNLINTFNTSVKNEFEITNYTEAVSRDFGLSKDYIYDLITIAELFKKSEIVDSVYFSYYRALKRKYKTLVRLDLFEQEKRRLNKLGNTDSLPGREQYKKQLIETIHNASSRLKKTNGRKVKQSDLSYFVK